MLPWSVLSRLLRVRVTSNDAYRFQCILSRQSALASRSTHDQFSTKPYYNPFSDYQHKITTSSRKKKKILVCGDGDLSYGASLAIGFNKRQDTGSSVNETSMKDNVNVELTVSVLECETVHNQGTLVKSKKCIRLMYIDTSTELMTLVY